MLETQYSVCIVSMNFNVLYIVLLCLTYLIISEYDLPCMVVNEQAFGDRPQQPFLQ